MILTAQSYYVKWLYDSSTTIYAQPYSKDQTISSITWSVNTTDSFCTSNTLISSAGIVNGLNAATLSYDCYKSTTITVTATAKINGQNVTKTINIQGGSSSNPYVQETHVTSIQTTDGSKKMEIGDEDNFNIIASPNNAPISDILYKNVLK